jgi:hypothetical protein
VSDKSSRLKVDQDSRSLFAEAITFEEDQADLQDKYDLIFHTTSQKLAAPAAELTSCERQVESSLTPHRHVGLHDVHESRIPQRRGSSPAIRTRLPPRHADRPRATAELGAPRERHTAIEVHREENRALERREASADDSELRETVVHLEAEVATVRAERKARCVSLTFVSYFRRDPHIWGWKRLELAHLLEEHGADHTAQLPIPSSK